MTIRKLAGMAGVMALMAGIVLHGSSTNVRAREDKADDLPGKAYAILKKNCAKCHSKDAPKLKGKLDLWDAKHLMDAKRMIVVAGEPKKSELIARLRPEDETTRMPPKGPLSDDDVKVLTEWVAAGAKPVTALTSKNNDKPNGKANQGKNAANNGELAARVKELFRTRCFECHNNTKTSGGVKILDHGMLVDKKKIVPGKADDSLLYQLITAKDESIMPPTGQPKLDPADTELVRQWIAAGAPPYPEDVIVPTEKEKDNVFKDMMGVDYVLKKILGYVRDLPEEERPFIRFISINHILTGGATPAELDLQRHALAKALNHMTWESEIVPLKAVDSPTSTIFAIDLRKFGWNKYPYKRYTYDRKVYSSYYNTYDMILLDYPYGVYYQDSDTFDRVVREYMVPVKLSRPIPYIRGDWFVSAVTQPPLYEDVLALPFHVSKLEEKLEVKVDLNVNDYTARRAGMTVSGVSRNNRVVERHPMKYGSYWKSFDFRSSKGQENMFKDPIYLNPTGGEFIFTMPNKLQGYYVADAKGNRLELAPTDIVTDKFAEDKTVRNGLACMRCHDSGMKGFTDTVRPALDKLPGIPGFDKRMAQRLYAPQKEMDGLVKKDGEGFGKAMELVYGKQKVGYEPLYPVSHRYLDAPIHLSVAAGELGYADGKGLESVFRAPNFTALGLIPLAAQGVVRRDAWEDYYDQAVRGLGAGTPIVPIDGNRRDYQAPAVSHYVELKTNHPGNTFKKGDDLIINVKNKSDRNIWIELVGTGTKGQKQFITRGVQKVAGYGEYRYPPTGKGLKINGSLGKEQITMYASYTYFQPGEILRGKDMTDRFVHPFYRVGVQGRSPRLYDDAYKVAKKTIEIETR